MLLVVAIQMAPQLLAIRRRPVQDHPPQFPLVEVDVARQHRPAVAAAAVVPLAAAD